MKGRMKVVAIVEFDPADMTPKDRLAPADVIQDYVAEGLSNKDGIRVVSVEIKEARERLPIA